MARALNGSEAMSNTGGAAATAVPLTLACWFWAASGTMSGSKRLVNLKASASSHHFGIYIDNRVYARTFGGSDADATSSNGSAPSEQAWHHACGVFAASNDRRAYLNGGNKGTNATSQTPSGLNQTHVGTFDGSSSAWNGRLAEAAVWSAALTDEEVLSLARGVSPLLIRPDSLASYWPLVGRDGPEIDVKGGRNLTLTGTSAADHPRVYRPHKRVSVFVPAAGGGGGNRRRRVILCGGR